MARHRRTPWDVSLTADKRRDVGLWLSQELINATNARTATDAEIQYWHTLYEQGRTRSATNAPWADAADLTSSIGTEKVDALRARIVKTIFTDPIWTVEGWGDDGPKAPFVEEFLQWQAETTGFQPAFVKAMHLACIEPRGTLEVYEEVGRRPVRKQIRVALVVDAEGRPILGDDLRPQLQRRPDGSYVEAREEPGLPPDQQPPSAQVVIDDYEFVAVGPRYRVIPYRDFLILPGHAREQSEVWGYAKRFYRRVEQLQARADDGVYDPAWVQALGDADERLMAGETDLAGQSLAIPTQEGALAEKELHEVTFLRDLDGTGPRWYVATVHQLSQTIGRLQYDDIGRPRYLSFVPFPRADRYGEGYSFIGHKLITPIEENTAWRNMLADSAALRLQAPILRRQNALWQPDDAPLGPRAILDVRDMDEIQMLQMPDYSAPGRERIIDTERQAEKLGGLTDIATGSRPNESRTLGETRLVTAYSEVRIEEVVRNIQETLEEVAQVSHLIWVRALSEREDGLPVPERILQGLELRGVDVSRYLPNQRYVASVLAGAYRFKPRGSVETADKSQQRRDFAESLSALATLAQAAPMIGMLVQQPNAAKALLEQWARLFNIPDKRAFLGSEVLQQVTQQIQQAQQAQQAQAAPGMAGPLPGNPTSGPVDPGRALPQEQGVVM